MLLNTGGGVVGGDRLEVTVEVGPGAQVRLTSQAAEKIYRSAGRTSMLEVRLEVSAGAFLEWLPQETILFDRCDFVRQLMLDLAPTARAMVGEVMVFGRAAHGESLRHGRVRDRWSVRRGERLLWADALRLEDPASSLHDPFGLAGARAMAILIYAGADAGDWLEPARDLIAADDVTSGVTCLPGVLIGRWLGPDAHILRAAYARFAARLRTLVAGLPERLPSVWAT